MKTRLTHVRANVKDLQKSIEWYENVIGFISEIFILIKIQSNIV